MKSASNPENFHPWACDQDHLNKLVRMSKSLDMKLDFNWPSGSDEIFER